LSEILFDLIVQDLDVLAPHRRAPSDRRNNAGREEGEASEQADVPFDGGARTRHGRQRGPPIEGALADSIVEDILQL
jgi:hypothetical protein